MDQPIPVRSQLNPGDCWAVEDIFPTEEAWAQALEACKDLPQEIAAYKGRLGESAQTLLRYLSRMEAVNRQVEKIFVYAFLRLDEDTADSTHRAMKGRCFSFVVQLQSAASFEGPELVAIPDETLDAW